ncbi:heparin lyase I family protein (plasmid) [Shimia sp. W99]
MIPRSVFRPCLRLLAVVFLVSAPAVADTYYQLDFDDTAIRGNAVHEDGRTFQLHRDGGGQPARILHDPGKGSDVLELRTTPTPSSAGRDRSELQIYSGVDYGRQFSLGFRLFVPDGSVFSDDWHLLMQCHQAGTTLSPPLSLNLEPSGALSLVVRDDTDPYERLWSGPLPRGRWVPVVLEFRLGENGRLRLWVNERNVSTHRQPLGWATGESRCVLKIGLYRGPAETGFALRLDDIRLGDSYRDARP